MGMDEIVSQYQQEAEGHVSTLRVIEFVLFFLLLSILLVEGTLIFRPTTLRLNKTIREITDLENAVAQQKRELESGIEQILQTHVETANGNFQARAPLSQDHVLWQIAYALNNLIARLQRLGQVENELQQARMEARNISDHFQQQANQIKAELQQIQKETVYLVGILHEAKLRARPIPALPSQTILTPLYRELVGSYVYPALPPANS
jgi:uncharacterized phage infection (PIP) family protein YhgE